MSVSFNFLGRDRRIDIKEILRFAFVGVCNTAFGYGIIFACMYLAGLSPIVSNILGYGIGLLFAYKLHRNYTFGSVGSQRKEAVRFLVVFAVAYSANLAVLYFVTHDTRLSAGWSQIVSGAVYVTSSFVLSKFFVFRDVGHPAAVKADGRP